MPVFVDGHHLITPTSVAKTGTGSTATINTNGSVTFSSCATLSLNGVFSADYDNYIIIMRHVGTATSTTLEGRLRSSGTDASASNYTRQYLLADSTSVTGARESTQTAFRCGVATATQRSGDIYQIYGPFLEAPTAMRNINAAGTNSAYILDAANTHSLSTSYDGFSIIPASGTLSGLVCVYGAVK